MRIDTEEILLPVAMVTSVCVFRNWGDPYGVGTQLLDVVELLRDALERPSAVVAKVRPTPT